LSRIHGTEAGYYADGEDAFAMRRELEDERKNYLKRRRFLLGEEAEESSTSQKQLQ
tara:strand:- start:1526 stop:1693 length:168 start_codon:yes stop_codon:yes gene_type:complete